MTRKTSAAITTACIGMAVGTAAYMASGGGRSAKERTRQIKRTTGKALRQVGDFIDNLSYMMR
jgi:hypothetical protein